MGVRDGMKDALEQALHESHEYSSRIFHEFEQVLMLKKDSNETCVSIKWFSELLTKARRVAQVEYLRSIASGYDAKGDDQTSQAVLYLIDGTGGEVE